MSLVVSAEMSGLQRSSSHIPTGTIDARFINKEKILDEINKLVESHQISAIYDLNDPKMQQNFATVSINQHTVSSTVEH